MKNKKQPPEQLEIVSASDVTPHSQALYEAGKSILIETISTGREFCKFMVTTSFSAIPVYLGILTFLLPEKYALGKGGGLAVSIPAILYFVASMFFTIGYLPVTTEFSLDIINEIERERRKVIRHRNRYIAFGMMIFSVATIYAIYVIAMNIGVR